MASPDGLNEALTRLDRLHPHVVNLLLYTPLADGSLPLMLWLSQMRRTVVARDPTDRPPAAPALPPRLVVRTWDVSSRGKAGPLEWLQPATVLYWLLDQSGDPWEILGCHG